MGIGLTMVVPIETGVTQWYPERRRHLDIDAVVTWACLDQENTYSSVLAQPAGECVNRPGFAGGSNC